MSLRLVNNKNQFKTMYTIKLKKVRENAILPTRVTKGSAAYDAIIPEDYKLKYGKQIIPLGWCSAMPNCLEMNCRTRAGYAAKGLKCEINGVEIRIDADVRLGLIDSDFRNEIGVILDVKDPVVYLNDAYIRKGQALAQLDFSFVPETELQVVEELDKTERTGGFGEMNNE